SFQIGVATADGEVQLAGKYHGCERLACSPAPHRCDNQALILAEQNAAQRASATKQVGVWSSRGSILLSGQNIHTTSPQSTRDRPRRVYFQLQPQTHSVPCWAATRRCSADGLLAARNARIRSS